MQKAMHKPLAKSLHSVGFISAWLISQIATAQQVSDSLDVSALYTDNIGLASLDVDQISDALIEFEASRLYRKNLGLNQAFSYGASALVRDYESYPCDRITLGFQLEYERKLGVGFNKPRLTLAWSGARNIHDVTSLNGYSSEISATLFQPINERLDMSFSVSKNWEIPDDNPDTFGLPDSASGLASNALDEEFVSARFSGEYYISQNWSLPFSLNYLGGDVTSIARLRAPYLANADAVANDRGLGPEWFIYRSDGRALTATLAASRLLKDGSQLNFEVEFTKADSLDNIKYNQHSIAVSWVKTW